MPPSKKPWHEGENRDLIFYLLVAIFFVELIVGGVAFFYGIIHAIPEKPGGPPLARFPWLGWALASVLAPVALLLLVHLAGSWVHRTISGQDEAPESQEGAGTPERVRRFYASVRQAPTLVVLVGILLLGAGLFFVEGAFSQIMRLCAHLVPYIPWIAGSLAALLAICFICHAVMVFRQRKMEQEYAWRREVLQKTGLVLVDRSSVPLPRGEEQKALIAPEDLEKEAGPTLDIEAALPPGGEKPETGGEGADQIKQEKYS